MPAHCIESNLRTDLPNYDYFGGKNANMYAYSWLIHYMTYDGYIVTRGIGFS